MFVPAKTPKEIVARLSKEVEALLKDPAVVKNLRGPADQGGLSRHAEPFTRQIKKETDAWEKVIKTLGIKAD